MADFGYYEYEHSRSGHDVAGRNRSTSASGSGSQLQATGTRFEYGHGYNETSSNNRDGRRPPSPLHGGRSRNDRQSRHDQHETSTRTSLLKTPPPSQYNYHDYGDFGFDPVASSASGGTAGRGRSPGPRSIHTHERSRSPLLSYRQSSNNFDKFPRDPLGAAGTTSGRGGRAPSPGSQPHYTGSRSPLLGYKQSPNNVDKLPRDPLGFEESRTPFDLERELYFDPNLPPQPDLKSDQYSYMSNKYPPEDTRHSRDRDDYNTGVLGETRHQRPLLPEPEPMHSVTRSQTRSFSQEVLNDGNSRHCRIGVFPQDKPLLPDPEPLDFTSVPDQMLQPSSGRRSFSPKYNVDERRTLPLLSELPLEQFSASKSVQDVLGEFVLPTPQDVPMQLQQLVKSQELLQKLEQKDKEKDRRLEELKKGTRNLELRRLGVIPKSKSTKKTRDDSSGLDPARKRQIDEELRRLGVGTKRPRVDDDQQRGLLPFPRDEQHGLLPEPKESERHLLPSPSQYDAYPTTNYQQNRERFSNPEFQSEVRRHTLLPEPSLPQKQGRGDGLLPTPEGAGLGRGLVNAARRKKLKSDSDSNMRDGWESKFGNKRDNWESRTGNKRDSWESKFGNKRDSWESKSGNKQDSWESGSGNKRDSRENKSRSRSTGRGDKQTQGRSSTQKTNEKSSNWASEKKNERQAEKPLVMSSQQSSPSNTTGNLPDESPDHASVGSKNKGKFDEIALILDAIQSQATTLTPSSLVVNVPPSMKAVLSSRKKLVKLDDQAAGSQFNLLYNIGENARLLVYDKIFSHKHCYICDKSFATSQAYLNHENDVMHKSNNYTVQQTHDQYHSKPVNEVRIALLQRLVTLPSIYEDLGKGVRIKPELIGRDDFYFICRICHDVYRGPAEEHCKTDGHKSFEWQQIKCTDCNMLFSKFAVRKRHYQKTLHQKIVKANKTKKTQQQKGVHQQPQRQPVTTPSLPSTPKPVPKAGSQSAPKSASTSGSTSAETKPKTTATATTPKNKSNNTTTTSSSGNQRPPLADKRKPVTVTPPVPALSSSSKTTSASVSSAVANKGSSAKGSRAISVKEEKASPTGAHKGSSAATSSIVSSKTDNDNSSEQCESSQDDEITIIESVNAEAGKSNSVSKTGADTSKESCANFVARIPGIVKANPEWKGEVRGLGFTSPVSGFFCKVCGKFYNEKKTTREEHCAALEHHLHIRAFRLKSKQSLRKWMEELPGCRQPIKEDPAAAMDDTNVVDMEVEEQSPDISHEETTEWFEGDLGEEV